jgi:hypothetical protein
VDIFNGATWSVATLALARSMLCGTAVNGVAVFAGGSK